MDWCRSNDSFVSWKNSIMMHPRSKSWSKRSIFVKTCGYGLNFRSQTDVIQRPKAFQWSASTEHPAKCTTTEACFNWTSGLCNSSAWDASGNSVDGTCWYGRYHIDMVGTTLTASTIPTSAGFLSINHTIVSVLFMEGCIQFQSLKMNAKTMHPSV